jgi:DNA-binding NarL/FixJ family response regulator
MRVLLADDHGLIRDSLRQYLEMLAEDIEIVEGDSLHAVLAEPATPAPDLILLDLHMPGMNGPASVAEVRAAFPISPIVVISGHADQASIRTALHHGANGFVPKTSRGKSLVTALKLVMAGETYVPPTVLADEATSYVSPSSIVSDTTRSSFSSLTDRENEVLRLLIAGKSNKEIGRDLNLQEVTVKVHLRNIYRKIKATSRTDAVRIALQKGWH